MRRRSAARECSPGANRSGTMRPAQVLSELRRQSGRVGGAAGAVGMGVRKVVGWLAAASVAALVAAPLLAMGPAAVLDRGPSGSVRATVLYLALAAFDPFVWGCVWHSVTVATVVSFASWLGGVWLARALERRRFWGRRPLAAVAMASLAVPPLFSAIGLRGLLAQWGPWPGDAELWLAWIWVAYGCRRAAGRAGCANRDDPDRSRLGRGREAVGRSRRGRSGGRSPGRSFAPMPPGPSRPCSRSPWSSRVLHWCSASGAPWRSRWSRPHEAERALHPGRRLWP